MLCHLGRGHTKSECFLDRGLIRRMLVLCPAHLCDQWAQELSDKFGLRPAVIQPANFARLEREVPRAGSGAAGEAVAGCRW